jgi:hypothetical protein
MRGAHDAGQTRAWLNVDGRHEIESQQGEIVQVVLRQLFAAQVRVDAAQATEAISRDALASEVWQLDAFGVADCDVFDVALAINEHADLSAGLVREFGELTRELRRDDSLRRNAPRVEFLDAAQLVGLETLRVAFYVTDSSRPPKRCTTDDEPTKNDERTIDDERRATRKKRRVYRTSFVVRHLTS